MSMTEGTEVTFIDLVVLQKIKTDSVVEKFGHEINTSFFAAANILGTLKIKGLVAIDSGIGFSPIMLSEKGKEVLAQAEVKTLEELDALDTAVIDHVGAGMKDPVRIAGEINVRQSDLAFRLNKLVRKGMLDYQIRSSADAPNPFIEVMLTEAGFSNSGHAKAYEGLGRPTVEKDNVAAELLSDGPVEPAPKIQPVFPPNIQKPSPVNADAEKPAGTQKQTAPQKPFKPTPEMRLRAKIEYYVMAYGKYAALALLLIVVAIAYYMFSSGAFKLG